MVILSDPLLLWAIEGVNDNAGLLLVPVNVAFQFPLLIPQPTRTSPIASNHAHCKLLRESTLLLRS